MQILKKYFYKFYLFIKKHKNKWLMLIAFSILFFVIRFPYQEATQYLITKITQKTNSSVKLQYKQFYINPFNLSLVFNQLNIVTKKHLLPLKLKQLSVRLSYSSLLQFKIGYVITIKWPHSTLDIILKNNKSIWLIIVNTQNFDSSILHSFLPSFPKTTGKINFDMEISFDPAFAIQPEGFWNLNSTDFTSDALTYAFPGSIGSISLPNFKWSEINFNGIIKDGKVSIHKLTLGKKNDAFYLNTRGIVFIDASVHNFSNKIIPHFHSYNIGLDILISQNLRTKLYFLNTIFSSIESKTPKGWHYLGQIKGNSANFFDLSSVIKLPTLHEIQNPTQIN